MTFRDETDALRAQKESLEDELEEKERELAAKEEEIVRLRAAAEAAKSAPASSEPERPGLRERLADLGEPAMNIAGFLGMAVGAMSLLGTLGYVAVTAFECATGTTGSAAPAAPVTFVELTQPATVSATDGPAPVPLGTACVVAITSQPDEMMSCRVTVECSGTAIYGAREGFGFLHCEVAPDKTPLSGMDSWDSSQDGDPQLVLDLAHHRVEVRDGTGASAWGVTLVLGEGSVRRVGTP